MCMMCLKYRTMLLIEYETPRTMRTNFIDKTIKSTIVRSRAQFLIGGGGAIYRLTRKLHSKILQNVAKFMMIFCRKKKRTNAKSCGTKVADRQHVGA